MPDPVELLGNFVTGSSARYGKEYSVRWRNGQADRNRFLLSVNRQAIANSDADVRYKLENLFEVLSCPPDLSAPLWEVWNDTCFVHLGYEEASTGPRYVKVYFEVAAQPEVDLHREQLVHVAAKWDPGDTNTNSLSRYALVPCQTRDDLAAHLSELCPERLLPAFDQLVSSALDRCDSRDLMLLAVTDDNSPRRSCDLNLYNGQLLIGENLDALQELAQLNDCDEKDWLYSHRYEEVGHLAAGTDRNHNDFVTLYYGIEGY